MHHYPIFFSKWCAFNLQGLHGFALIVLKPADFYYSQDIILYLKTHIKACEADTVNPLAVILVRWPRILGENL